MWIVLSGLSKSFTNGGSTGEYQTTITYRQMWIVLSGLSKSFTNGGSNR